MNFIVIAAKFCNLGERQIASRQIESRSCHTHKNQILLKGNAKQFFIDKLKIRFTYIKVLGTSCNWMLLLKWIRNFKVKLFKLILAWLWNVAWAVERLFSKNVNRARIFSSLKSGWPKESSNKIWWIQKEKILVSSTENGWLLIAFKRSMSLGSSVSKWSHSST